MEAATSDKRVHLLQSRTHYSIGSYLGVPLMVGSGELYGTLCVADPDAHRFGNKDLDMLTIVAAWLGWYLKRN
ncbi:MAG: GAF domain-containing protein [Chloroflexota bacterium]|nr:GAF domain-containing protein [Chloroflexota bacterium]